MDKSTIRPNKEWKKVVDIMEREAKTNKDPIWEEHKQEWKIFWNSWQICIWHKWILSKIHNGHEWLDNDVAINKLHKRVKEVLSVKNSALKLNEDALRTIDNSKILNKKIHSECLYSYQNIINKAFNSF